MRIGSLVETQHSFDDVRKGWGFNYPHKGDILTISDIQPHPVITGIKLLFFEESDLSFGLCDKQVNEQWNFLEIQEPMTVSDFIEIDIDNKIYL